MKRATWVTLMLTAVWGTAVLLLPAVKMHVDLHYRAPVAAGLALICIGATIASVVELFGGDEDR